jgi:hypothetical protein
MPVYFAQVADRLRPHYSGAHLMFFDIGCNDRGCTLRLWYETKPFAGLLP